MDKGVSIIVPFLNEYEGLQQFCKVLDEFSNTLSFPIELVFVDDGSTDDSASIVKSYYFNYIELVKLVVLSKNYGSHAAVRAGIKYASYDFCTWIGSDLQEPLEFISMAYNELVNKGIDAVYIEKGSINISSLDRGFSKVYSALMRKFAVSNYSSSGINNIMFNNKIKDYINQNEENNSSIMLQIIDCGFKSSRISLEYKERNVGISKWTFSKKVKLFIDSFVSFSFMPIRLVSIMGICIFCVGLIMSIAIIMNKIVNPASIIQGYSTIASICTLGFGLTNISLGIIAEYLWRTYDAARKRPLYLTSEIVDIKCLTQEIKYEPK